MTISGNQVNAVIRTYLKNARNRLTNANTSPGNPQGTFTLAMSEDSKKILYERISKVVVKKIRTQMTRATETLIPNNVKSVKGV